MDPKYKHSDADKMDMPKRIASFRWNIENMIPYFGKEEAHICVTFTVCYIYCIIIIIL
jgi:hypothetical protein